MRIGAGTMLLEVGTRNTEAQQLYRRGGYQPCDPFPALCGNAHKPLHDAAVYGNHPMTEQLRAKSR